MYFNSPGGVVTAGMAIYDTMQFIRPQIATLCIGQAASMGSLLLCAGTQGLRYALPNARIMVHQPSGGFSGQASDIERHAEDIIKMKRGSTRSTSSIQPALTDVIERTLDRDYFMTADQAKDFGIIDKVFFEPRRGRLRGRGDQVPRPEKLAIKPKGRRPDGALASPAR